MAYNALCRSATASCRSDADDFCCAQKLSAVRTSNALARRRNNEQLLVVCSRRKQQRAQTDAVPPRLTFRFRFLTNLPNQPLCSNSSSTCRHWTSASSTRSHALTASLGAAWRQKKPKKNVQVRFATAHVVRWQPHSVHAPMWHSRAPPQCRKCARRRHNATFPTHTREKPTWIDGQRRVNVLNALQDVGSDVVLARSLDDRAEKGSNAFEQLCGVRTHVVLAGEGRDGVARESIVCNRSVHATTTNAEIDGEQPNRKQNKKTKRGKNASRT